MSKRFKTTGNYFVVGDTETGLEEIREAKGNISYKELQGSILFFLVSTGIKISANLYNKDNIVNGDSSDAPFADIAALKKYLDDNTAFSSASGSSGALSIPDKFVFLNETARDNYFLANPDEKINGITVLVEQPTMTLERWNGTLWYKDTSVVKGDKGDKGDKGEEGEVSLAELQKYPKKSYTSINYIRRLTQGRGWTLIGKFEYDRTKVKITKINFLLYNEGITNTSDVDIIVRNSEDTSKVYFYKSNIGFLLDGYNIVNLTKVLEQPSFQFLKIEIVARKKSNIGKVDSYSIDLTFEGINA